MNATIINLIITGVVALFIVFGMFWGLVRGLKRTAIRSLWLMLTALILGLFLSSAITNMLMNLTFTTTIDGVEVHSIQEAITTLLNNASIDTTILGENIETLIKVVVAYTTLILNSIIFVLSFWILKILLLPVNWALSKWVFLSKKEKEYRKQSKEYKKYCREYAIANKGKPRVEAVGFAVNDNFEPLEEELKELKEGKSKEVKKGLNELIRARQAYDNINNVGQINDSKEDNELLNRPYVAPKEEKVEDKKVEPVEEEFIPKDEHEPKKEEIELKPVEKPKKLKKHRFAGMLLGGVCGLLVGGITLSPAIGILKLAQEANTECIVTAEDNSEKGILDYLTNDMFTQINDYYASSVGGNILKYTGTEWVANETFTALTKTNIDGVNVDFTNDFTAIISIVNEANVLMKYYEEAENNNYPVATVNKMVLSIENIVDKLFEISLVDILSPALIDICANEIEKNIQATKTAIKEGTQSNTSEMELDNVLLQVAQGLRQVGSEKGALHSELKSIVNILKILNHGVVLTDGSQETSLLSELLKSAKTNSETDIIRVIQKLNYEYYKNHNQEFYFTYLVNNAYTYNNYNTKVVASVMPTAVQFTLNQMLKELGMQDLANVLDVTNDETVKTFVLNTFTEVFRILFEFNTSYDSEGNLKYTEYTQETFGQISLLELNKNIFISLGKIVDGIGTLFDDTNYNELVSSIGNTVGEMLKPMFSSIMNEESSTKLTNNIADAVRTFEKGAFVNEFEALGDVFNYLIIGQPIVDENGNTVEIYPLLDNTKDFSFDNQDKWSFEIGHIKGIGTLLNSMQNVSIFKYMPEGENKNNLSLLFDGLLNKLKETLNESIEAEASTPSTFDSNGYINNVSVISQVLYNAVNVIQVNLNNGLDDKGAFDWSTTLGSDNLFLGVLDDILKQSRSEEGSEKLLDITRTNSAEGKNIIEILLNNTQQVQVGDSKTIMLCALDTMKDNSLFAGLTTKVLNDLKAVIPSMIEENFGEQKFKNDIKNIIVDILDNLASVETSRAKSSTYCKYIEIIDSAIRNLFNKGAIEIDITNITTMRKLGLFLDTLTTNTDGVVVLKNEVVVSTAINLIDSEVIETLTVNRSNYSIIQLLTKLKNNIDTASDTSSWATILGTFAKIATLDFSQMEDTKVAMEKLGSILDDISGREFKLEETDEQNSSVTLISDDDVKLLVIGLISNNVVKENGSLITSNGNISASGSSMPQELLEILFTLSEDLGANADSVAILNNTIYMSDTDNDYKYFGKYNVTYGSTQIAGVLENLYYLDTRGSFTWKDFCNSLQSLIDLDGDIKLGKFAYSENDKTYTYYETNPNKTDGTGSELDNLLNSTYPLLNITHVKYLLDDSIDSFVDSDATYLTGNIINQIKSNIANISDASFDKEFKSVQYLIDITNHLQESMGSDINITEVRNFGAYLDELNDSQIVGNLGESIVSILLDKVYENTEEKTDEIADKIAEIDNGINSFLETTDVNYFFVRQNVNNRIKSIYANKLITNPNTTIFSAIADIKEQISNIDASSINPPEDITGMVTFKNTAYETLRDISIALDNFQNNVLIGVIETRYITASIMQQMVTNFDTWCTNKSMYFTAKGHTGYTYTGDTNNRYNHNESLKQYIVDRIASGETETYIDGETSSIKTDFSDSPNGYDYILERLLDDFIKCVSNALGISLS